MIDDKFRVTSQSDFSIKKIFRREFGQTNKDAGVRKSASNKDVDGNRASRSRRFNNDEGRSESRRSSSRNSRNIKSRKAIKPFFNYLNSIL